MHRDLFSSSRICQQTLELGGWNDGTESTFPDWLQVDFSGVKSIDEVDVFSVQDNYASPSEPTTNMTFTTYGLTAFQVQTWDGAAWNTVSGGSVTGNNLVWRKFTFAPISTSRIRIYITASIDGHWSRVTEVEAYTSSGSTAPTIVTQSANQSVTVGQTATFTVAASGTAPLSYQWRKNGANIAGATATSYTTPATVIGDNGALFSVVVTNVAGNAVYSNGTFTVKGSGTDIWGASDRFQYVYEVGSGDCEIRARVASVQNVDPWARAGVMIRETLNADSRNASVFLTPTNGVMSQWRGSTGGATSSNRTTGVTAPYWVRVARTGNSFVGYRSTNGTTWTAMSTQSVTMATNVYLGLSVGSHVNTNLCTGVLDSVTATP